MLRDDSCRVSDAYYIAKQIFGTLENYSNFELTCLLTGAE